MMIRKGDLKGKLSAFYFYKCFYRAGRQRLYTVQETWKKYPSGIILKKNSHFMRPYERAIVRLREAGVFEQILSKYKINEPAPAKTGLTVLKLEHYEGPFYLLLIFLTFDIVIFLIERGSAYGGNLP